MSIQSLLSAFLAALSLTTAASTKTKRDSWGGAVSLGPTKSHIVNAITILIPGPAPATQAGELFLWPGMSNGTGDLIQTTLESWNSNAWCGATTGERCADASLFGSFGQLSGVANPVKGTDHVRIEYTAESNGNWTQQVTYAIISKHLSSYSHQSGPMTGWGTGTECEDGRTSTSEKQRYLNTTITLASGESTFGSTIATSRGATYSGLSNSDDYTTWHIEEIVIPAMT